MKQGYSQKQFSIEQFDRLSKPLTPIASRWNLSKFVILKHSGREILHLEPFVAFFSTIYMLRSLFVKVFQQNMNLNQRNLRRVPIDLKLNNLDLSGNTTEFKTLPTRQHSHRYILFYIFAVKSVKICRFKTFWMSIFARGTLLLFRCLNIHVKMFVLLRYCARK